MAFCIECADDHDLVMATARNSAHPAAIRELTTGPHGLTFWIPPDFVDRQTAAYIRWEITGVVTEDVILDHDPLDPLNCGQ